MKVRLFKPYVNSDELKNIEEIFDLQWLGLGEKVYEFERKWSKYLGSEYNIAVNSATAALHLSLMSFNFPKRKKVLVPSLTFSSTAMVVEYCDLEVVFIDVRDDTLTLDMNDLVNKIDSDCVAVIPVHYGGHPVEMDVLMDIAREHNLKVIEDCAHTQGGDYQGKKLGTWGDIGCFSFEEKKGMTTGDGGMISTNDEKIAEKILPMRWVGIDKDTWRRETTTSDELADAKHWYYEIRDIGYKYNMNNLAASIGLAQLEKIGWINSTKNLAIQQYLEGIAALEWLSPLLPYHLSENSSYWLFGVRTKYRDRLMLHLQKHDVATGVHFTPLHLQPLWRSKKEEKLHVCEKIYGEILTLPLFPGISEQEINYVIKIIKLFKADNI
jgi:perosamine synthetase